MTDEAGGISYRSMHIESANALLISHGPIRTIHGGPIKILKCEPIENENIFIDSKVNFQFLLIFIGIDYLQMYRRQN